MKHLSMRTKTEDASHVNHLLALLRRLPLGDPPLALRERRCALASARLANNRVNREQLKPKRYMRLKPFLASTLLIAAGLAVLVVGEFRSQRSSPRDREGRIFSASKPPEKPVQAAAATHHFAAQTHRVFHHLPTASHLASTRRIVLRLPYSTIRSVIDGIAASIAGNALS